MIRVMLVADGGRALEAMTRSVSTFARVDIVCHCHGHAPIAAVLTRIAPDLVIVDEMGWPKLALRRIEEIRAALPQARIVVRTEGPEVSWLADALRAGADAVVPATAGPETLGLVIAEVVGERHLGLHDPPAVAA